MIKKADKTTVLYVRAVKVKNKQFLSLVAKRKGYSTTGQVLNEILDSEREKEFRRMKRVRENKRAAAIKTRFIKACRQDRIKSLRRQTRNS